MTGDLSYRELFDGDAGDVTLNVKLTARQLAALELVLDEATSVGLSNLIYEAVSEIDVSLGERFRVEFGRAQSRLGVELFDATGSKETALAFAARLAAYDQEAAQL